MGLEAVGDLAVHIILRKLGAQETARAACVSKQLRASASDDSMWSHFCATDLHLSQPLDPLGNRAPSFKVTYQLWRESFCMYPWSLVKRVKRCWDKLENWLALHFPEASSTLNKGASEAHLQRLQNSLGIKLPLTFRLLYRFHDGQDLDQDTWSLGLIGGYSFYDHIVNVSLLPLGRILFETNQVRLKLGGESDHHHYLVVAASSTYVDKLFLLNSTSGQLYVGTSKLVSEGEMLPCVPNGDQGDAMLLWLEEHCRRLENGFIKLRQQQTPVPSISQFPEESPLCSTAVTSGVKVRASAVFIPEVSGLQGTTRQFYFAYSIRMSLLPEGCSITGMTFNSCQLLSRHWIIRDNDVVVADVNGEGVIGKFPLLRPGDQEFVYESCTPLPSSSGSIEGSFMFVLGRLGHANCSAFEVLVAQFPLQLPDYIF